MSAYKELPSDNVSFREFVANKQWIFTQDDTDTVQVRSAYERTGSYYYASIDGVISASFVPPRTLYDSIKHLYYNETSIIQYTGSSHYRPSTSTRHRRGQPLHQIGSSDFTTGSAAIIKYFEPFNNFGPNSLSTYKMLGDRAVVVSVPQERFGDGIQPETVQLEDITENFTLYDDGKGNLYDVADSASFVANKPLYTVGNVFYEHGNMVITSTGSNYQNFGTGSNNYTVQFRARHTIYELEAYCTAKAGEFNTPMNPSSRVSRSLQLTEPLGFVTSSDFSSYVTTIGLYDDNLNLLVVGKTAQPIRNETDLGITFVVRLDF
jgi:hypothetical protein